jgi:spore maturation protein CgeB
MKRPVKILVAGAYETEWRAQGWARALELNGAQVSRYDWNVHYSSGTVGYLERRLLKGPGIKRINEALLQHVERVKPDVTLVYAGKPIMPETVRVIAARCAAASYENDDPFGRWSRRAYYRFFGDSLAEYTCHHVFRAVNIAEYRQHGCERVRLLRSFYLPWVHQPAAAPVTGARIPVVFVGNGQPGSRIHNVTALVRAQVPIRIFGHDTYWRRYLPSDVWRAVGPVRPAGPDEYASVLHRADVCLAFFSDGNRDQYSLRSFEIPACGRFMLAERTPVMMSLYDEGTEAEFFSSPTELVAKIRHALAHPERRAEIAAAGHGRCVTDGHDIVTRMRQWLSDLAEWNLVPPTVEV